MVPSQEVRDAVLKAGMEQGAAESYDKLVELLAPVDVGAAEAAASGA